MYAQQFTNDLLASTIDMYNDGRGIGLTVFSPLMKKEKHIPLTGLLFPVARQDLGNSHEDVDGV